MTMSCRTFYLPLLIMTIRVKIRFIISAINYAIFSRSGSILFNVWVQKLTKKLFESESRLQPIGLHFDRLELDSSLLIGNSF